MSREMNIAATIDTVYDAYLNVSTQVEDGDELTEKGIYNAYEATSYFFLERLFTVFPFAEDDRMVDFGCGKGRVLFMAAHHMCNRVTGYENNSKRFGILKSNLSNYQQKHGKRSLIDIRNENAQSAVIDDMDNKFFFFEPFHIKIFKQVVDKIMQSLDKRRRDITIILYLPHESTIEYFDSIRSFKKEIYVDSTLYFLDDPLLTMPHFAIYCNYSLEDLVNPYFLIY